VLLVYFLFFISPNVDQLCGSIQVASLVVVVIVVLIIHSKGRELRGEEGLARLGGESARMYCMSPEP